MSHKFIQKVKFDEAGLIATVVQDALTGEVIALCYIDNDTLARSLQTGETDFFSGSEPARRKYPLLDVRVNADGNSLTVQVRRDSGETADAKATGIVRESVKTPKPEVSLVDVGSMEFGLTIGRLYDLIVERNEKRPEGSYTTYLLNSGLDKILKKVAEESGEVIIAAKNKAPREMVSELADLFYHLLVLMVERDVKLSDVGDELSQRAAKNQPGVAG